MIKIKNRCCYTVTLILCGTLFLTGLTGCKSREAQFLIEGLQEAKAEVDAESSEEKTSGQKSKKDTDEKKADTEDRQNDGGNSAEFRKKQAESDGSDAGNGTESDSGKHTSDADIDNGSEAVSDKEMQHAGLLCVRVRLDSQRDFPLSFAIHPFLCRGKRLFDTEISDSSSDRRSALCILLYFWGCSLQSALVWHDDRCFLSFYPGSCLCADTDRNSV